MARIKKQVKKYIKENQPSFEGLDKKEKKAAAEAFEAEVKAYTKGLKKKRRKKRILGLFALSSGVTNVRVWRAFHSKASKKYKRKELGRR